MKITNPRIGWFCSYAPVELIEAAGLAPVRVSGLKASTGVADSLMHTNICPYIKACIESLESGALDDFGAFLFTNGCDAQRRLYDVWGSRKPNVPTHLVVVPKGTGPEHVDRFAEELEEARGWLAELSGAPVTDEALRESMRRYSELRVALRELPPMSGSRSLELHIAAQRTGPSEALEMLRRETATSPAPPASGPVVLLYGNMLDDVEFVRGIEKFGVRVASDDLCVGRRFRNVPTPDPVSPPMHALASAYMAKDHCPRMTSSPDAVDRFRDTLAALKPDGVIIYTLKFCDTHLYDVPRLRDTLREADVRALFLEGDYSGAGSGQLETRIQAFVELLG